MLKTTFVPINTHLVPPFRSSSQPNARSSHWPSTCHLVSQQDPVKRGISMMRQKQIWSGWGVLLLAMMVVFTTLSFGQATSGDLVGKVVDSSGAVVSNATVEAVNI